LQISIICSLPCCTKVFTSLRFPLVYQFVNQLARALVRSHCCIQLSSQHLAFYSILLYSICMQSFILSVSLEYSNSLHHATLSSHKTFHTFSISHSRSALGLLTVKRGKIYLQSASAALSYNQLLFTRSTVSHNILSFWLSSALLSQVTKLCTHYLS
jgi:hypothetical protein